MLALNRVPSVSINNIIGVLIDLAIIIGLSTKWIKFLSIYPCYAEYYI